MAYIPAGSFQMGEVGIDVAEPVHTVTLDGFYMDRSEVTVGQFRQFVTESGYNFNGNWNEIANYSPTDDYPMVSVTWDDAVAYATWAGKRLPTEAEWEKAARGGLDGKPYPWGDEVDDTKANYASNVGKTTVAGSYYANGYGLYDVAGNVWEWCADWYDSGYYASSPATNPLGPDTGSSRVLRGGNWYNSTSYLQVASRFSNSPNTRDIGFGFRCVLESNQALISFLNVTDLSTELTIISGTTFSPDDIDDALLGVSSPTDFEGFVAILFSLLQNTPPSDLQLSQVRVAISATSDLDNPYHLPFTVHSDLLATALGDPFDTATVDTALANSSTKSLFITALSNTQTVTEADLDTAMAVATKVNFSLAAQLLNTDYIDQALLKMALDSQTDGLGNTNFHQAALDLGLSQSLLLEKIAISQAKSVVKISLVRGLNIISLPNRPDTALTAYSLAQQISTIDADVSVNFVIRMDPISQQFKAFVPSVDASDSAYNFSIDGGSGYIINLADADPVAAREVSFSGGIWVDLPGAPTAISTPTWAFVIDNPDPVQLGPRQAANFRLIDQQGGQVRWQGQISTTGENRGTDRFRLALVDQNRSSVVEEGDQLDLQIYDQQGDLLAFGAFEVGSDQISRAMVQVELRLNPIPSETQLLPNYPNPFNPETWIPYQLSQESEVSLEIYDGQGHLVRRLQLGWKDAGYYTTATEAIYWDGRNTNGESVSSGVYFYRLQAGNFSQTRKMVILK